SFPCRHSICKAPGKTGMLLLSYQTSNPKSGYGHPTPIFIRPRACDRFDQPDTIPDFCLILLHYFRAFSATGIVGCTAAGTDEGGRGEGGGDGAGGRRSLACHDGACINAHTTRAGCMLCHIERV